MQDGPYQWHFICIYNHDSLKSEILQTMSVCFTCIKLKSQHINRFHYAICENRVMLLVAKSVSDNIFVLVCFLLLLEKYVRLHTL